MTAYVEMIGVLNRLASMTSIRRTQSQETERTKVNGGSVCDLQQRVRTVIERLERTADELEKTLQ